MADITANKHYKAKYPTFNRCNNACLRDGQLSCGRRQI
jgi:hypothetical protein